MEEIADKSGSLDEYNKGMKRFTSLTEVSSLSCVIAAWFHFEGHYIITINVILIELISGQRQSFGCR